MVRVDIRQLTVGDLDGALALSTTAGWNQRTADWRMLLDIAPAGSFTAVADGRVVGTAIGIDYGRFGWIAMMLVDPAHRGRGLGARLLEAAMSAIPPRLPIRLDATPLGRPLYRRHGFEDDVVLNRFVIEGPAAEKAAAAGNASADIRPLAAVHLPSVMAHDGLVFRGNRRHVLEWAMDGAPRYAWLALDDPERPQYCLGRPGRLFDQIGPVIARNHRVAAALVGAALRRAGDTPVAIDVFDARETFGDWLRGAGFQVQRPLYRMCRPGGGPALEPEQTCTPLIEYAILGPEFA
jgi:GNAT superfamily N-acetyltransferase